MSGSFGISDGDHVRFDLEPFADGDADVVHRLLTGGSLGMTARKPRATDRPAFLRLHESDVVLHEVSFGYLAAGRNPAAEATQNYFCVLSLHDCYPSFVRCRPPQRRGFRRIRAGKSLTAFQQSFVFVMRANPEPIHDAVLNPPQGAMAAGHARRPVVAFLLETHRGMPGILQPEPVSLARLLPRGGRQAR